MKTKTKIALARAGARVVRTARGLVGKGDICIVERNGVVYELDLRQGIDFAIYLLGYFEPATAKVIAREIRPGANVLDIGANIGAHTLHMAKAVGPTGKVVAFEPTDYAFGKLMRNTALNPSLATRIMAKQCFLGPRDDVAVPGDIYSAWPLEADAQALHSQHLGEPKSTSGAVGRSVDSVLGELGRPKIDLVKLDVDGHECDVLAGAGEMMARDRPSFVMELSPYIFPEHGATFGQLMNYFLPLGYQFQDERTGAALGKTAAEIENRIGEGASRNAIARPA